MGHPHFPGQPVREFEAGGCVIEAHRDTCLMAHLLEGLSKASYTPDIKGPPSCPAVFLFTAGYAPVLGYECLDFGYNMLRHVAVQDVRAVVYEADWLLKKAPRETLALVLQGTAQSAANTLSIPIILRMTQKRRLINCLLGISRLAGADEIPMSQDDLACLTGMSRSALSPLLRSLAKEGLIEVGYKGLQVLNSRGLMALLGMKPYNTPSKHP